MKRYGYIEENDGNSEALYSENGISEIIKSLQKFGAIEETGIIDNATLKLLTLRRCGVPDIIRHKRHRRYILGSNGWNKRNITYFLANWSPKLGEYIVLKNIQKALDTWGGYGRLHFQQVSSPEADIIVAFGSGEHGDSFPFDGPGNVLAHAFFPHEADVLGGDIHFDADENWILQKESTTEFGTDFYSVALHELGHSLGLAHSAVPTSVMFPYYKESDSGSAYQLDYDDILGMYKLYISRILQEDLPSSANSDDHSETSTIITTESPVVTTGTYEYTSTPPNTYSTDVKIETTTETIVTYEGDAESVDDHKKHDKKHGIPENNSPSLPNICDGYVDAVATLRNELFVFKGQYVWRYKEKGKVEPKYPVTLTQMFPNLPTAVKKIDAAYQRPDGMIVVFTGNMFWIYDGEHFLENSPKPLMHYGLPAYVTDIDAIQTWGKNKKTYIYKGERFWRYNESAKAMDPGYPLHMERWRGAPEHLDAATTWKDGATYFFKANLFWKFDNDWVMVTEQSPLPTAQVWFGCPEEKEMRCLFSHNTEC